MTSSGLVKVCYRISEASETTGLPEATFWRAIRDEKLVAHKSGRSTFIMLEDLVAYLKACPRRVGRAS